MYNKKRRKTIISYSLFSTIKLILKLHDKESDISATLTIEIASPPLRRLKEASLLLCRRLVFSQPRTDGDVAESPAGGPVPLAAPTKVSGLINIVVVEVTKLGLRAFAPRTRDDLVRPLLSRPIFRFPWFTITIARFWSLLNDRDRCSEQLDPRYVSFLNLRHGSTTKRD